MRIVLLCEGKTEAAIKNALKEFLDSRCAEAGSQRVGLDVKPFNGPAWDCEEVFDRLSIHGRRDDVVGVIALTDVYPKFDDATAAKKHLEDCVKDSPFRGKFRAHAAQYELEAWLLPFWDRICRRLGVNAKPPGANPEEVNNQKPPSRHLRELYAKARRGYEKPIEARNILLGQRIEDAAEKCPQLRELLDTLVSLTTQHTT